MTAKLKPLRAAVLAALVPAFIAGCNTSTAAPAQSVAPAASHAAVPAQQRRGATTRSPTSRQLAKEAGPAVVNISVTEKAAPASAGLPLDENDPMYQFFRRFQGPGREQAPHARRRLGLHRQPRRLHPHQRARRRRRERGGREAHRPARVHRQGGRHRQEERRRADQDRREEPADGAASATRRTSRSASGSWPSARRSASRTRSTAGIVSRQVALAAGRRLRAVHPDRRRGEPRQLRRPAVQHATAT